MTWLREGDKNTKFFHRVANARRREKTISRLEVEGEGISNSSMVPK